MNNFHTIESFNYELMNLIEKMKLFKNKNFFSLYSIVSSDIYHIVENLESSVELKRESL